MSLFRLSLAQFSLLNRNRNITQNCVRISEKRYLTVSARFCCTDNDVNKSGDGENESKINPAIDRTKVISIETSLKYMTSEAYKETYGENFVWEQYRRNHKGLFPPRKTRKTCVRKGLISTGNPCPICRDEYLVLDHRNLNLLKQFISPHSGEVLSYSKTGLCQRKHLQLLIAIERAMDHGLLTFDVPFREYNYSEYYDIEDLKKTQ